MMERKEMEDIIERVIGDNVICIDKSCVDSSILSKEVIVSDKWIAKRITRILRESLKKKKSA